MYEVKVLLKSTEFRNINGVRNTVKMAGGSLEEDVDGAFTLRTPTEEIAKGLERQGYVTLVTA